MDVDGEIRLTLLNEALVASKHKRKSTYNTWVSFFTNGPGVASEVRVEAMLSFWLSWYILPSGPKDGLNAFVFPLAIHLARGEKVALAPIFLGSLFYRLDECVQSLVRSMGRYTVASYAQTAFLQMFLWERFKSYSPQPTVFEASTMVMVEDENGMTRSVPDKPEKMRAQRWSNLKQVKGKNLIEFIDSKKHFSFRPYRYTPRGISEVKLYANAGSNLVDIPARVISAELATWLAIIAPHSSLLLLNPKPGWSAIIPRG